MPTQPEPSVLSSRAGAVCTITLNRPDSLNAINADMLGRLLSALIAANADPDVVVILLRGAGRAYCAGKDLKEHEGHSADPAAVRKELDVLQDISRQLLFSDKIVLAGAHGWAVGGGFEWLLGCDLIILAAGTRMFLPEMALGLFVTGGTTALLPRLIGVSRAKALILSGRKFDAHEALEMGLAWQVVATDEFDATLIRVAQELAALPGGSARELKKVINNAQREEIERALQVEAEQALRTTLDPDTAKRIARALNRG